MLSIRRQKELVMRKQIKLYKIDYLMNAELTDDDIHNLLDNHALEWSLINRMMELSGNSMSTSELRKTVNSSNTWMDNIYWTNEQSREFHNELTSVYMNVYQWKESRARSQADWFIIYLGIRIK